MDGSDWQEQECEGQLRGRPNCLWPGCKHEGEIGRVEKRAKEQWYLTPRLCLSHLNTPSCSEEREGPQPKQWGRNGNISGAKRLIKDHRTRKTLSEVNNKIGRGQNSKCLETSKAEHKYCSRKKKEEIMCFSGIGSCFSTAKTHCHAKAQTDAMLPSWENFNCSPTEEYKDGWADKQVDRNLCRQNHTQAEREKRETKGTKTKINGEVHTSLPHFHRLT